jgi:hypothetical protein
MRRSTRADGDRLSRFYRSVFTPTENPNDETVMHYIQEMLNGQHPTFQEGDFTFIEDTRTGQIVSAMNLISQTWTYGGIPILAGRPEMVATDKEYRNQGLVRAQFEVVHQWSRQRGEMILGITGIPFYYRLFGYEMCVEMEGGRTGTPDGLPELSQHQLDSYRVRIADETDIPFLAGLYQRGCERLLVACPRDEFLWRFELLTRSRKTEDYRVVCIIETLQGEPLGFFLHLPGLGPDYLDVNALLSTWFELKPGVSYLDVTPVVLQHLLKTGRQYAAEKGTICSAVGLFLQNNHPAYQVVEHSLPRKTEPYAWYIRIPDLPAFLRKVAPVLEKRLQDSFCSGHTGEVQLTFYRSKLSLSFNQGRLEMVEQQPFSGDENCQAGFPGLSFLQLIFGYRTLDELEYMFPDCWVKDELRPLLRAIFPRCPSSIWPF